MPKTTQRKQKKTASSPMRVALGDGSTSKSTVKKNPKKKTNTVKATTKTAREIFHCDEVQETPPETAKKQTRVRHTVKRDLDLVRSCITENVDGPKTNPTKKREEQERIAQACSFASREQAMARWGEIKTLVRKAITWEKKQFNSSGAGVVLPMKTLIDYPGWPRNWKGQEGSEIKATLASLKQTRETFNTSRIKSTTEMDAEVIALDHQNSQMRKPRITPAEKRLSALENVLTSSAATLAKAMTSSVVEKDKVWLEKKFKALNDMFEAGILSEEQRKDAMSKALNAFSTN